MRWRSRRARGAALGLVLAVVASACASPTRLDTSARELRRELRARLASADEVVVLFDVDAEAIDRARGFVGAGSSRARLLADSLGSSRGFDLRYEWARTGTASQTLAHGGGNCLALSSVLVGLARGMGLEAHYLEVRIADPKRRLDGDLSVYTDHVAAVILDGDERLYVDYSGELAKAHRIRAISDVEATAHYFTNRGYERIHLAESESRPIPWAQVERDFELSVQVSPQSARAWNNLAVARTRTGNDADAREAYLEAIALEPDLATPHVNLVMLYVREGALRSARTHLERAEQLDPVNPQLPALRRSLDAAHAETGTGAPQRR